MAASSSGKVDAKPRLAVLKARLFRSVCRRVCKGLLNKDRLLFAVRLAQVNRTCTNSMNPETLDGRSKSHLRGLTTAVLML